MGKILPETIRSYVSAIRSYHVDIAASIEAFDHPHIKRILSGIQSIHTKQKAERSPLTRDLLAKIVPSPAEWPQPSALEGTTIVKWLNINAAFTTAFAGFLRLGEITYTAAEARQAAFALTKATRGDITFGPDHMVLRLKRSKTDKQHQGVQIPIAATGDQLCPVAHMKRLLHYDPQPRHKPLFNQEQSAFTRLSLVRVLNSRLTAVGIDPTKYNGHSFRKGAAQWAVDHGCTEAELRLLSRWTSTACRLYYTTSQADIFRLNARFQTGRSPRFSSTADDASGPTIGSTGWLNGNLPG